MSKSKLQKEVIRSVQGGTASELHSSDPLGLFSGSSSQTNVQIDVVKLVTDFTEQTNKKLKDMEVKVAETTARVEDTKTKIIETLGVFTALFTFISIDFQLLKDVQNFAVSLSIILITAGVLILFILLLDWIARYWKYDWELEKGTPKKIQPWFNRFTALMLVAIGLLIAGGIIGIYWGLKAEKNKIENPNKFKIQVNPTQTIFNPTTEKVDQYPVSPQVPK